MILIDRSKEIQTIVLTLSELTDVETPVYILNLKGDGKRDEFNIELPENLSTFKERFDLFQLDTDVFDSLSGGIYTYSITLNNSPVETGKAIIKDVFVDVFISPNSSFNDTIIAYGE